ncbi:Maf family protein [Lachnospiraceae bacterium YH-ros2228]
MNHQLILASGSPRRLELLQQIGIRPIVIKSRIEEQITESDPALVVEELSQQKAMDVAENLEEYMIESSLSDMTSGLSETNIDPVPVFHPSQALVLGADTVVACDGKILGKPHLHDEAFQMIQMLQGRYHQVFTGVTLVIPGGKDHKDQLRNQMTNGQLPLAKEGIPQSSSGMLEFDEKQDRRTSLKFDEETDRLTSLKFDEKADRQTSLKFITFHEKTDVHVIPMSDEEIRSYADGSEPMDKAGAYGIQGSFGKFIDRISGDDYNVVGLPLARVYTTIREIEAKGLGM